MRSNRFRALTLCTVASGALILGPVALAQGTNPDPMAPTSQIPAQPTAQQPNPIQPQGEQSTGISSDDMRDKMFLHKAAEGGMAEVQFGQLAVQKAASDDVKQFGQKMIDDHTQLNDKMMPINQQMGIAPPKHLNKEDQATYDKLSVLSGDEFDKAYLADMVQDHRKDLRAFRQEETLTTDPTIKAAVVDGEKVIREHLILVSKLARDKGVVLPGGRPGGPNGNGAQPPSQ